MTQISHIQALPSDCHIPSPQFSLLALTLLPVLRVSMSDDEILRAHEGDEAAYHRLRAISCRGCAITACRHNPKTTALPRRGSSQFASEAGELIAAVLPPELKESLEAGDLTVTVSDRSRHAKPAIVFCADARRGASFIFYRLTVFGSLQTLEETTDAGSSFPPRPATANGLAAVFAAGATALQERVTPRA